MLWLCYGSLTNEPFIYVPNVLGVMAALAQVTVRILRFFVAYVAERYVFLCVVLLCDFCHLPNVQRSH